MGDTNKILEVYTLLENNYVIIPKHIKNIFNKLNLVGLRVWANIQDSQFVAYEDVIKEILAKDKNCKTMNEEQKKALFGEIFWNNPEDFKFLPGDKAVIAQMREVSKELVKKMTKDRERVQAKQAVWPIIDIDVEIKEEHEKSEVDEKGHGILTPSSKTNDCDKRADPLTSISEPNVSVSSGETKIAETVDESEANATISQSVYEVSGQEPASSSITAASDDWNLLALPDNEPKTNYSASKSVGNHEWAKSANDWEETNRTTQESGLPGVYGSESNNSRTNRFNYAPRFQKSGGKGNHCYKFNKKGHVSYNNPIGPTRPTRGGGGGGSPRLCFKCNQEGHMAYNCPTASTGRRGERIPLPQSVFADWGTLAGTPATKSSSALVSWENKNDWGSAPDQASIPWSTGAKAAAVEARNTPRSSYNASIGYSQPVLDDWGIASNSSAPVTKTANNSVADDWGPAVDAWSNWPSVKTAKTTPRPGNSSAAKSGGDDLKTLTVNWEFISGSNTECIPPNDFVISRPGPKHVLNSGANDWGVAADVSQNGSLLINRASASPILSQTDWNGIESGKGMTNNQELSQSRMNPVPWTGTINHGRRSFKVDMKSLDVNAPSVLADLEMPKSMRVVGTIEPEKVWPYLRRVSESINERICVFQFTPATNDEMKGYEFFYDELSGMNWFAVIADASDSKLPWSFKDFYVLPLAKDSPIPSELTSFIKKSFVENQSSDFLLGVVVFRTQRLVEQSGSNADVDPSAAFPASQKSYNSSVELNPERNFGKPDWTTALASTTSRESSKPNFIIPKSRPNFLDRSPTVATSSVKLSADPTTSVAHQEIRKEKAFLNMVNVNIATQKPTSMHSADLASITSRNIRIPDFDDMYSSQSVQAAFPPSNSHGPLTRSKLRNSAVVKSSVYSTVVPFNTQNPASVKDMEKKVTKRSNLSRSTSVSSPVVSPKVQKTTDVDSKVTVTSPSSALVDHSYSVKS